MINVDCNQYLYGELPPRDKLWAIVRKAHSYLHEWVNDPSSRVHPTLGRVEFDALTYGTEGIIGLGDTKRSTSPRICYVCLAGLFYLRVGGELLTSPVLPHVATFLDFLRYPYTEARQIDKWLGVPNTYVYTVDSRISIWDTTNPHHILDYLSWLLDQHNTPGVEIV